ncbi:hypothetical protein CHLRE_09g417401v5 [Chlamydomonas reinhardtii]|uniref:Uncharacterized protein n=1 Tax=Chlamydomonas reinhardtii TaxID=3055 RepID=A0A2K3DG45_CHLRE|nr:uncharacterized protein CHLRE_09g417401v5 [Chlamydomonas reinhardtii]XP_042921697.1 uncharacterized protein CHLRE_09g417401v5 [Chlamydomonas reinhardtii]PNW79498.1 hypothetical protein CHLRE_09g417401v5 [Chlamydomonas reinhardtii]PNW79499.1 hypothetical protein CHLRE_09g417401v5 [Chlamydomonas reinhardtii]
MQLLRRRRMRARQFAQARHRRHQRARRRRPLHLWSGWVSRAPTPPLGAAARSTGPLMEAAVVISATYNALSMLRARTHAAPAAAAAAGLANDPVLRRRLCSGTQVMTAPPANPDPHQPAAHADPHGGNGAVPDPQQLVGAGLLAFALAGAVSGAARPVAVGAAPAAASGSAAGALAPAVITATPPDAADEDFALPPFPLEPPVQRGRGRGRGRGHGRGRGRTHGRAGTAPLADPGAVEPPRKRRRSLGTDERERDAVQRRRRQAGMNAVQQRQHLAAHAAAEAERREGMDEEQRAQYRAAQAAAEAERREGMDEEQQAQYRAAQAAAEAERREGMDGEQRAQYRAAQAAAEAERREGMDEEQRAQYRAAQAAAEAERREGMDGEQRAQYRAAQAAAEAERREGMDEEQRAQYRAAQAAAEAERREGMDEEQRAQYRAAQAAAEAARVAVMPAQQQQERRDARAAAEAARREGMDEEQRAGEADARRQRRARQRFTASTERGPAIKRRFEESCDHVCECCNRCFYRAGVTVTEHPVACSTLFRLLRGAGDLGTDRDRDELDELERGVGAYAADGAVDADPVGAEADAGGGVGLEAELEAEEAPPAAEPMQQRPRRAALRGRTGGCTGGRSRGRGRHGPHGQAAAAGAGGQAAPGGTGAAAAAPRLVRGRVAALRACRRAAEDAGNRAAGDADADADAGESNGALAPAHSPLAPAVEQPSGALRAPARRRLRRLASGAGLDAVAAPAGLADAPVARAVPADVAELPGLEDDGVDSDADEPRQAAGRALPPELRLFGPRPDCSRGCAHNHQVAVPHDSPAGLEPSPGTVPGTSGGVAQQRAGGNAPAAAGLEPANAMRLDRLIATAGAQGAAAAVAGAIVGAALHRGAVAAGNVGDGEEDASGGGADARATVAPEPPLPPVDVVMADANPVLPRDALHTATTRAGRAARAREERTMATTITTRTGGVLSIHAHPDLEPAAFPNLYPYGTNHFCTNREQPIGIAAYFTNRVQNADPCFQLPVYLAWAVSLSVYLQLRNQISVSLRIQQNGRAPRLNTLRRQVAALHRQHRRQDAAVPDPAAAGEAAPPRPAAALLAGGRPGRWNLYSGGAWPAGGGGGERGGGGC